MSMPTVRRQGEWVPLTKAEFRDRFFARFYDPAFDAVAPELERVFEKAWEGYGVDYRKSPRTQPAGPGYADPAMACQLSGYGRRRRSPTPNGAIRTRRRRRASCS